MRESLQRGLERGRPFVKRKTLPGEQFHVGLCLRRVQLRCPLPSGRGGRGIQNNWRPLGHLLLCRVCTLRMYILQPGRQCINNQRGPHSRGSVACRCTLAGVWIMWPATLVSCNASQSAIAREMIAAKGGKPTTFFHDSSDRSPTTFSAILTPYFPRIVQFQARSVYVLKQFIQMFCTIYPDDLTVVPCRFVTRND